MASGYDDKTSLARNEVSAAAAAPPGYTDNAGMFGHGADERKLRQRFIRKVFVILGAQLLFTFGLVCAFTFSAEVKLSVRSCPAGYYASFAVFIASLIALSCCGDLQRRHPWNLVCLALVTLSLSYMVGMVASYNDTTSVMIALGSTVAVCLGVVLFSSQTRLDLTYCYGSLLVFGVVLLMFGFFCIFFYNQVLQVVYGSLGALLFSLFLALDIQLVLGKNRFGLSPEEYVFAALTLYLDIINIFSLLLMSISICRQ